MSRPTLESDRWASRMKAAAIGPAVLLGLLASSSVAQSIPPKGTSGTFEVASWNVEFFGGAGGPTDDERQISNVRDVILDSDVDLWALQEIADETDFFAMVASLGPQFDGELAPTSSAQGLGLAFIYRKDTIRLRHVQEILEQFSTGVDNPFAGRPPFQLEADVMLGDTTIVVTIINLHMKAQSDQESYGKRAEASLRLKNHIDFSALASKPVIVLGDLNDLLQNSITSGRASPYKNFVDDVGNYGTPTLQMQIDGRNTYCFSTPVVNGQPTCNGSTIDHVIISNEVEPWYVTGSADHYDELLSAISGYVNTTSDHLPVFALFDFARGVNVVDTGPVPAASLAFRAFPNPFDGALVIELSTPQPCTVSIEVIDMTGRRVATSLHHLQAAGAHRVPLNLRGLPSGPYVVSATSPFGRAMELLLRH